MSIRSVVSTIKKKQDINASFSYRELERVLLSFKGGLIVPNAHFVLIICMHFANYKYSGYNNRRTVKHKIVKTTK